ncbi:MAG: Na+/H+ antiporter NhaC family protein [Planctomycetota bacterium]
MLRLIAVLIFGALFAALLFGPRVHPSAMAPKQIADLLEEPGIRAGATEPAVDENGKPIPLWRYIVDSGTVAVDPETGERVLRTGSARIVYDPAALPEEKKIDPLWTIEALRALVRRMRAVSAKEDLGLRVDAYKKPDPTGVNYALKVDGENLTAVVDLGGEPLASAQMPWQRITQRSLIPPLIAIFLAILLRRPVIALLAGVWAGAFLVRRAADGGGLGSDFAWSAFDVFDTYARDQLIKPSRIEIVAFVVFMLAMVGVITKAGGIRGVMNRISSLAEDARKTQIATWLMGLAIFFDDYANSILVGSTMRPLADKFRVAREKLAYIVDSTAAPVAGVSLLSTWIAFEVSTFSAQLPDAGLAPSDGYAVFLQTLPYRFYCWFTLLFVAMIVFSGRDFGPMLRAERRARGGQLLRPGATPMVGKAATELEADESVTPRASSALIPLALFVLTTLGSIVWTGMTGLGLLVFAEGATLPSLGKAPGGFIETATGILYEGSGEVPLRNGAIAGFTAAAVLALGRGLSVGATLRAAFNSIRATGVALVILYLAWMVGAVCSDLGTATYLSSVLGSSTPYVILPIVLFLLAGLIAFSTGSSWSTMTILLPLVIGLTYDTGYSSTDGVTEEAARAAGLFLMTVSIGAVLEGAIFGDHCSPISDTTVMSSIACASDHVDHVRTQAPYALTTMAVALLVGYLPVVFFGLSPWLALLAGAATLALLLAVKGERAEDGAEGPPPRPAAGAEPGPGSAA